MLLKNDVLLRRKEILPPPVISIIEPSIIAVAPHLTHSITFTYSNRLNGLIRKEVWHSRHLIRSSGSYGVWLTDAFKSILPPSAWEHTDA